MTLELHIHFPGFDLPSIDPYCLSVLCYLQITAPGLYSVIYSNNNTLSPTGKLPALRDSGTWIGGWNNIIDYLKQKGFDADDSLTDIQKADSIAYESLIHGLGFDLTLFNIYVDDENYSNVTRPLYYKKSFSFLSSYLALVHVRNFAKKRTEYFDIKQAHSNQIKNFHSIFYYHLKNTSYDFKKEAKIEKLKILSSNFYRLLAFKLSSQPFIFGDQPTSLDCLIFGHLALQFFPTLSNSTLSEHLKTTEPLLVSYLHHSFSKYFQENKPLNIETTKSNYFSNTTSILWNNFISFSPFIQLKELVGVNNPEKRRKFFTVTSSILGFIFYVYITGIIKIETEDHNKNDSEEAEPLSNDSTV
ncbi:hypothetical protein T552_00284 [Pneumocystis carinii B80]|uniref:Mitochondrial outer membrane transport complex Sam37/metaxin N-terminal domain-containing protein n=1 Tax=Pneumocystis carinii (strain B80) TaxID=1408658 RepID=A0A0W4ZTD6_PNEC8|nr:hypothetical protein T552_00284 [Pneumocystis carinii B80]KTW31646.1 hypothetical protein T552_00284 [Pneumocystis carinii B80]